MSRGRFGLLLGLLVAVAAVASFVVVLALIGDDGDPGDGAGPADTTTTTSTTTSTPPGELVTPTFVAIVSSDSEEARAEERRGVLTGEGYDAGVLHSDDHTSLAPGFWVAYVGPFADAADAQGAVDELRAAGYTSAYVRCVGTDEQCT